MAGCAGDLLGREVRGDGGRLRGRSGRGEEARRRDMEMRRTVRWIEENTEGRLAGIGGWHMLLGR